jgi:hypothetical protein
VLSHFRVAFYDGLNKRADALLEPADAVLCADGPMTSLAELTPTAEHQCGHGAMCDTVVLAREVEGDGWSAGGGPAVAHAVDGRALGLLGAELFRGHSSNAM